MNEFIKPIVGAIVGAILWEAGKALRERLRANRAPHTGQWQSKIAKHGVEEEKEDIFHIRQKGDELSGTIIRHRPEKQRGRKWQFRGRLVGGRDFIAAFWGDSYGVWFLRKARDDDSAFDGRYLSIHDSLKDDGTISGQFDTVPMRLVNLSPPHL